MPVYEPAGSYWRTLPNGYPALFNAEGKVIHVASHKAGQGDLTPESARERIDKFLKEA